MEHTDNPLVVPVEYRWHTPEKPFCWDESCPCHEEQEHITQVSQWVSDGLLTKPLTLYAGGAYDYDSAAQKPHSGIRH